MTIELNSRLQADDLQQGIYAQRNNDNQDKIIDPHKIIKGIELGCASPEQF